MAKNYGIKGMTEEELRAHRQKQFNQMMLKKNRANTATVSNEQIRRQMQAAQEMKSNAAYPSLFDKYWPKDRILHMIQSFRIEIMQKQLMLA